MTESFEEVPGAKKSASRAEWERNVFQAAEIDERALKSYLDDLFIADKKDGAVALNELRQKVSKFETRLSSLTPLSVKILRATIQGLQNSDVLSNEKREALTDFLGNDVILTEVCDILNVRMTALDRWAWGPEVLLE